MIIPWLNSFKFSFPPPWNLYIYIYTHVCARVFHDWQAGIRPAAKQQPLQWSVAVCGDMMAIWWRYDGDMLSFLSAAVFPGRCFQASWNLYDPSGGHHPKIGIKVTTVLSVWNTKQFPTLHVVGQTCWTQSLHIFGRDRHPDLSLQVCANRTGWSGTQHVWGNVHGVLFISHWLVLHVFRTKPSNLKLHELLNFDPCPSQIVSVLVMPVSPFPAKQTHSHEQQYVRSLQGAP